VVDVRVLTAVAGVAGLLAAALPVAGAARRRTGHPPESGPAQESGPAGAPGIAGAGADAGADADPSSQP
ncbi:MFS transporter, partial [Streptomyces griseus]|nr:MFS transporter [Streptomyces griseus]